MTKSTSQAGIKPTIFVNFRPETDPKTPARLITLIGSCKMRAIFGVVSVKFVWYNKVARILKIAICYFIMWFLCYFHLN